MAMSSRSFRPRMWRALTDQGVIAGGMIPKTETALTAIAGGVRAGSYHGWARAECLLAGIVHRPWCGQHYPRQRSANPTHGLTMGGLARMEQAAQAQALRVAGLVPEGRAPMPDGLRSIVLLAPDEPAFLAPIHPKPGISRMARPTRWTAGPCA